jgi:hypothetical protein
MRLNRSWMKHVGQSIKLTRRSFEGACAHASVKCLSSRRHICVENGNSLPWRFADDFMRRADPDAGIAFPKTAAIFLPRPDN